MSKDENIFSRERLLRGQENVLTASIILLEQIVLDVVGLIFVNTSAGVTVVKNAKGPVFVLMVQYVINAKIATGKEFVHIKNEKRHVVNVMVHRCVTIKNCVIGVNYAKAVAFVLMVGIFQDAKIVKALVFVPMDE